jgi:hypothetical protein
MHSYANLTELRAALVASADSVEDVVLASLGRMASSRIDTFTQRYFAPEIATRYYTPSRINGGISRDGIYLYLTDPLLAVSAFTTGDGETTLTTDDYRFSPRGRYPVYQVERLNSSTWVAGGGSNIRESIALTGIWAYNTNYAQAWLNSGDTVTTTALTTSATSLTVTSASGADGNGLSPRFAVGQILKIESEFLCITGISSNTLTVIRGYRGSTAAAHITTTPIFVWQVEPDIIRACALLAAHAYNRRGQFVQIQVNGATGDINQFPPDMPMEVQNILEQYRRVELISI